MESFCFRPLPSLLGIPSLAIAVGHDARATQFTTAGLPAAGNTSVETIPAIPSVSQRAYMLPAWPLRRLWPRQGEIGNKDEIVLEEDREEKTPEEGQQQQEEEEDQEQEQELWRGRRRGNWVFKILRVKEIWGEEKWERHDVGAGDRIIDEGGDRCVGCRDVPGGCGAGGEEDALEFDRESFSRLLRRVSLAEAKLFAQLSYLGNLAYNIPKINPVNLLKYHGLRFVTSSLEMKLILSNAKQERSNTQDQETEVKEEGDGKIQRKNGYPINPSAAYQIAVSAASYLQSQTKGILLFKSADAITGAPSPEEGSKIKEEEADIRNSEKASFMATTDSITAMVAAKEETKQAVAKNLHSVQSSPCEWFICDNDSSHTRIFVIQGSESLASWQANLLFEPILFEGLDVLVHRGIYEAAKGIYEQMLPEVRAHLACHGRSATLRFTGHSLGGSLALLVNLMLLIRGEAPPSSLLPVITFGSPSIMCGGNQLLRMLGLPQGYVQAIMMHRDIVPRAFSCNYPDHVAEILKAINGKFRNHPCLKNQKMLYAPMGELLILQPDEKFSPHHDLLPAGSDMYVFGRLLPTSNASDQLAQAALSAFLNSPHPLETLSDRSAYGSKGTINRDHDVNAYMRALRGVMRQELKRLRKREHRRQAWWPFVAPQGSHGSSMMGRQGGYKGSGSGKFSFSGIVQRRSEPLRQFGRLVASRGMHLLVMLLLPVQLVFMKSITGFR